MTLPSGATIWRAIGRESRLGAERSRSRRARSRMFRRMAAPVRRASAMPLAMPPHSTGETPSLSAAVAVSVGKKASRAHSSATAEGRRLLSSPVDARRLGIARFMVLSTATPLAPQPPGLSTNSRPRRSRTSGYRRRRDSNKAEPMVASNGDGSINPVALINSKIDKCYQIGATAPTRTSERQVEVRIPPVSVVPVGALHALVPLLRLGAQGGDRTGLQAAQADRLAGLLTVTVGALLDALEGVVDAGDQLALAVAGA